MAFKLIHGGHRYSHAVDSPASATTNTFVPGNILFQLTADGELQKASAVADPVIGVAFDRKDATENEVQGSLKATVVMGTFIGESDQLESGMTFGPNERLYTNTTGQFTRTSGSGARCVGYALADKDSNGFMRFYWQLGLPA